MFANIRKFIELESNLDCMNSYQPLTSDKNQETDNYFVDNSICLSELNIPEEFK